MNFDIVNKSWAGFEKITKKKMIIIIIDEYSNFDMGPAIRVCGSRQIRTEGHEGIYIIILWLIPGQRVDRNGPLMCTWQKDTGSWRTSGVRPTCLGLESTDTADIFSLFPLVTILRWHLSLDSRSHIRSEYY